VVVPGANGKVDSAFVDRHADLIRSAGLVLCQLEIPMATISHVLALCAEAGVAVMLDPAPAANLPDAIWGQWRGSPRTRRRQPFTLRARTHPKGCAAVAARGLKGVVLKRGGEGSYVAVAGGNAGWVPAFKADVIDTVGAGDCFNGAFAVGLLEGPGMLLADKDPWAAARFASAAAAISVSRRGRRPRCHPAEVEEFLAKHN